MAPGEELREAASNGTSKKRPQFFRVLIPNAFAKLHIPSKFRRKYLDQEVQNKATLLGPHGKFFHLNLCQDGETIYFDESDWYEFAKTHELRTGYFLIFRYEGNMVFSVKVFDESCCLKEYDEFDSSSEDYEQECLTLSEKSDNSEDKVQDKRSRVSTKRKFADFTSTKKQKSMKILNKTQNSAVNKTKFPQFEKVVRPYSSKYMGLPIKFCKTHNLIKRDTIFFKNLKGKKCHEINLLLRKNEIRLGKGWRIFAEKSDFKDGDTCIFQLINKSTLLVQQKGETGETQQTPKKRRIKSSKLKSSKLREDKITPFPEFEKIIRPFNLKSGYLNIVNSFCLQNDLNSKRIITLKDSNGKKWPVHFLKRNYNCKLQKGWRKFSLAHDLKEGNKCIFKLVEQNTFLVHVEKNKSENGVKVDLVEDFLNPKDLNIL